MGQHFLADGPVLNRIVAAGEIDHQDLVLEIGPGTGALTKRLLQTGACIIAVELDSRLVTELPARMGNPPNLTVIEGDARTLELSQVLPNGASYKVLGNLPYYAANPIIRRFLEATLQPSLMVLTLQEEVARNMTAGPGHMGLLSVATQFYADAEFVCTVPAKAFRPPPKVTSAVVRLEVRPEPAVAVSDREGFFTLVRAGFSSPRKQLRNSLAHGLGVPTVSVSHLMAETGLDGSRRPATLSLEDWASLYNAWLESTEAASAGAAGKPEGR